MPRTAAAPWQQTYVAQEQAVSFAGPASVRTGIRPLSRLESRALQRLPGYGYMMLGWGTGCPTRKCTVVRSKFLVRRGAPPNTKSLPQPRLPSFRWARDARHQSRRTEIVAG